MRHGRSQCVEYLVKWAGYPVFESTWEPEANLANCPSVLEAFLARRVQGHSAPKRGG